MKLNQSNTFLTNFDDIDDARTKFFGNWTSDISYFDNYNSTTQIENYDGNSGFTDYFNEVKNIIKTCNDQNVEILYDENGKILYNRSNPEDINSLVGQFIFNVNKYMYPIIKQYQKMENSLEKAIKGNEKKETIIEDLNGWADYFQNVNEELDEYKDEFLKQIKYYIKVAKICGQILVLIYFCLLCTIATFGCILLILYSLMNNQTPLDILMHIVWNSIRFFIFSFFLYGAVFGMLYLGLKDAIAYNMFLFGENLNSTTSYIFSKQDSKDYLRHCLLDQQSNYSFNDNSSIRNLEEFYSDYYELEKLLNKDIDLDSKKYAINNNNIQNAPKIKGSSKISSKKIKTKITNQYKTINIKFRDEEGEEEEEEEEILFEDEIEIETKDEEKEEEEEKEKEKEKEKENEDENLDDEDEDEEKEEEIDENEKENEIEEEETEDKTNEEEEDKDEEEYEPDEDENENEQKEEENEAQSNEEKERRGRKRE